MKNKTHKRKLNKILLFMLIVVAIIICIILFSKRKVENINTQQIGKIQMSNYSIQVGKNNTEIDFDKAIAKTRKEINAPKLGAGMIPIIDLGNGMYEITTKDNTNWYDYSINKPAYMMLSDGYYKSEMQQGITEEQLAENNVGAKVPDDPNYLGTVYIWIPRFVYSDNTMGFLKETGVINIDDWITPSLFTISQNREDYSIELTGIWLEKNYNSNAQTKANAINSEENIYGTIANEKAFALDTDTKATLDIFNTYWNLENYVENFANTNRTYIQVVDTNIKTELSVKAYMVGKKVVVKMLKNDYEIDKVINTITGEELHEYEFAIDRLGGYYPFVVVDVKGNIATCDAGYEENPPDLTGFRIDKTYVVTYSGEINKGTATEISNQPISEILAEGYTVNDDNTLIQGEIDFGKVNESRGKWFQYKEQKWANILVRNNGNEAYFVWIPRYAYALDKQNQTTDVVFIDTDNIIIKTMEPVDLSKYTIPEAFTWVNGDGETVQLPGYWISKYQLSSYVSIGLNVSVYNGMGKIRLTNMTNSIVSNSLARYDVTLKKDGEVIKKVEHANPSLLEFTDTEIPSLKDGKYEILIQLYDQEGYYIGEITRTAEIYKQYIEDPEPNPPDLTGFDPKYTYYVTYDENGNETNNVLIGDGKNPPENWYNYAEQKWANILVRKAGNLAYFVWIPRYEYHAYSEEQITDVYFISTEQETPTYGYTIPEAFTWINEEGETVQLPGYWISKYQLSSYVDVGLNVSIYNGLGKIRLTNMTNNIVSNSVAQYDVTLKKDGEVVTKVEHATPSLLEFSDEDIPELTTGQYEILIELYDEEGYYIGEITRSAEVYKKYIEEQNPNPPDLKGFNSSITYYVTYDEAGNEDSSIPISQGAPDGWYNYAEQKWANIVVKNNDKEAYFVWIPRYEYRAYSNEQITDVYFIPTEQETPTYGYTIPEAFTWEDDAGNTVQLSGYWISKYQLSN